MCAQTLPPPPPAAQGCCPQRARVLGGGPQGLAIAASVRPASSVAGSLHRPLRCRPSRPSAVCFHGHKRAPRHTPRGGGRAGLWRYCSCSALRGGCTADRQAPGTRRARPPAPHRLRHLSPDCVSVHPTTASSSSFNSWRQSCPGGSALLEDNFIPNTPPSVQPFPPAPCVLRVLRVTTGEHCGGAAAFPFCRRDS